MKICPGCHRRYDDAVKFCPHDGTVLPDPSDEYVGRRLMEQFDILARCGEGAMGTVYRAHQINMDRSVAVKILRRDLVRDRTVVRRFYREAKAAARLSHPNIITVHLVAETDEGLPYIVMEFLEGTDLDTLCKVEAPVDLTRAVHIAQQIAGALSEAHQNDVIHRDLKPANIIVLDKQRTADVVKVLDFGIAKILEAGTSDESRITKSGAIFGTPYYLSPEQATGAELDARADLYSLGVILYRLATGHLPFEGGSGLDILVRHVKDPPPPPRLHNPNLPPALEATILRALEKDRDKRFASADEMRAALLAALGDAGIPAALTTPDPSSPWAVPRSAPVATVDDKKTVAGFSGGGGNVDPRLLSPGSVEHDPLVHAASRVLSSKERAVPAKSAPVRTSRPTVAGKPAAPELLATQRADSAAAVPSVSAEERPDPHGSGTPAAARTPTSPPDEGSTWSSPDADPATDDLPGDGRRHVASAAPAPVPRLRYDPESGQGVALRPHTPAAPAPAATPAIRSAPLPPSHGPDALPDSSPSMVSGEHSVPSASALTAYHRARDRGRWITIAATALAFVALGVGAFFVIRDQRERPTRSITDRRAARTPRFDARVAPPSMDAVAPRAPSFAAGRELVKSVSQGVGVRLSSESELVMGKPITLVLDLWHDGVGRPCADAEVTLVYRAARRRQVRVKGRATAVQGRYALSVRFRRPGHVRGRLRIRIAEGQQLKVPVRLEVQGASAGAMRPHPMTLPHMHARPGGMKRPRPRPMDTLPRPPPDEGMRPRDMLPELPMDPPTPPPDRD